MCKAIDDMRKESMAEGEARGLAAGKAAGIAEGEARGLAAGKAEGMAAGEAKALNQNIKTMYKNGADENMIAKFLELDINFVKVALAK